MRRAVAPLLLTLAWLLTSTAPLAARDAAGDARSNRGSSVVQGVRPPAVIDPEARPSVRVDPARALGSAAAPLAIVEFGDYQCPYCRRFHFDTLPKLRAAYIATGKVRYFYKDFPLRRHVHAFQAGVAARCAGAQGRYWQMQGLLYAEQARLGRELYAELAARLELDAARFADCLRSDAPRRAVNRDLADGYRLGVRATPTFVLGRLEGDRVVAERVAAGAPAFEAFAREIEALSR